MKLSFVIAAFLASTTISAFAADAKNLTVEEKVTINAPAAKVWDKVSNFGDLGAWHPAVKKTEITGGTNNTKGAERLLTLQDGGTIKEKLLAYNAKKMTFKYAILEGVLPVSSYVSSVSVKADGDKTVVTWKGDFKRKDTSAAPAAGQTDEDATKTMTAVYKGGLDNLKKITE